MDAKREKNTSDLVNKMIVIHSEILWWKVMKLRHLDKTFFFILIMKALLFGK